MATVFYSSSIIILSSFPPDVLALLLVCPYVVKWPPALRDKNTVMELQNSARKTVVPEARSTKRGDRVKLQCAPPYLRLLQVIHKVVLIA